MTEARPRRRPGAAPVFWTSLLLFCVLLGLLTYRFSTGQDPSGVGASAAPAPPPVRKVIVRRVVTTVIPAGPGGAASEIGAAAPPAVEAPAPESEAVPVSEPVTSAS
jgi:hypothetical protein